jgi:DNA-binding beta-propeller fold protein YncE
MIKKAFLCILAVVVTLIIIGPSIADQRYNAGAVYVMTNAPEPDGNEIAVYSRNSRGLLEFVEYYSTGGLGSGGDGVDPLASQESLVLSPDKRWLIAVNAGSNSISVFRAWHKKLKLIGTFDSGGEFPTGLTLFYDLVYVLNAGSDVAAPNITGFRLSHKGHLIPLKGSTRELESGGYHQVGFDSRGDVLVVTEGDAAGENRFHVFPISKWGLPAHEAVISSSVGLVPFGFVFDRRGHLLVSEAGSGAVTSYKILRNYTLRVISPSVENGQAATCWIAVNSKGYVYTANTGSNTISAYKVRSRKGRLALLDKAAGFGNRPIDMTTAGKGRFLYALNANDGTVGMFRINRDGSLYDLGVIAGLPSPFAQGIAGH